MIVASIGTSVSIDDRPRHHRRHCRQPLNVLLAVHDVSEVHLEVLNLSRLLDTLATRHELAPTVTRIELLDPSIDVTVDTRRFAYCYKNLVENADLYANGLTAIRVEAGLDTVHVHFDDAGPGIDRDQRDSILQPFIRGSRTSGVRGSGLGLAIVSEHMRIMNGSVAVDESPEGGARFTLTLRRGEPS